MAQLELRDEFLSRHMRGTAIELRNRQNTGWVQRPPEDLLRITYPTADVQRSLEAVSAAAPGKPVVFMGQRGRGKSHIMALLHHTFESPAAVEAWAREWGTKLGAPKLTGLKLQAGFRAISESMSNQEYATLWDVIFDRHPDGAYFKGKFEQAGTPVPSKTILQDMFGRQATALILDEFQTWFDGLHDEPAPTGPKRRQWAFNFIQILSELATERPDLFLFVTSVRDNSTDAFKQIHRDAPIVVDFIGETAKEDRKKLVLHRLFKNRDHFTADEIERLVDAYADERARLLYGDQNAADQARRRREVVESWPFSPELLTLLEDHILMAEAAQETRDLIRILAEVFRARGQHVPVLTAADFHVDDDECGVTTLIDSFATTADQERLREKAQRNLGAIREANVPAPHAQEVISSTWMRSIATSVTRVGGGTKAELQLDITRVQPVDDNAFTVELQEIVDGSFNIHTLGTAEKRYCFKLEDNPLSKLKAFARNDHNFVPQTATPPGLLPVRPDQKFLRKILEHLLRSPDAPREQPSRVIVLDPNWERAPWANQAQQDHPTRWNRPVLLVLPVAPADVAAKLGSWLATHVEKNRNMVRFLLPKADKTDLYEDHDLLILARCTMLAKEWMATESQYTELHKKFDRELRKDGLAERFDRYAILARWDYQHPDQCVFHVEAHQAAGADIPAAVEKHVRESLFAIEDFEPFVVAAARRSDTMTSLLALLRDPSPGTDLIPYLGDQNLYDQVLRLAAHGKVAINRSGQWHGRQPGQSFEDALRRLQQQAMPTGSEWGSIQLGLPSEIGSGGVAVSPGGGAVDSGGLFGGGAGSAGGAGGTGGTVGTAGPVSPPVAPPASGGETTGSLVERPPSGTGPGAVAPVSVGQPVVRRSLGPKTGINLLGDLEKWALPDAQRVTQATLTFSGASVKELRDLCTKLPAKMQAELQITLPPEQPAAGTASQQSPQAGMQAPNVPPARPAGGGTAG